MKRLLFLIPIALLSTSAHLAAQTTLYAYGESVDYVTASNWLSMGDGSTDAGANDINRAFSPTAPMSPEAEGGYAGPVFFGGWEASGSLAQPMDFGPYIRNDWVQTGGFDGIFFDLNMVVGATGQFAFLFMGETTPTNFSELAAFVVNAGRSSGSGNSLYARAVIRADGSYYVGATAAAIASGYITNVSLAIDSWEAYNPGASILTLPGTPVSIPASAQVDAAGVLLIRGILSSTPLASDVWLTFGRFQATAVAAAAPAVPVLTTSVSGGNLVITVPSAAGFDYQLQSATTGLGGWANVIGQVQSGTGSDLTFNQPLPGSGSGDFYRVEVTPAP